MRKVTCLICGIIFETNHSTQKFCKKECSKEYYKNRYENRRKKLGKTLLKDRPKVHCLICKYQWNSRIDYPFYCPTCKFGCWDFGVNIKCKICNKTVLIPFIHHQDGNHWNNIKENRIPLCRSCHAILHKLDFNDLRRSSKKSYKKFKLEHLHSLKDLKDKLKKG